MKRFASGTASREEARAVTAHLLKGCADCARKLRSLIKSEPVNGRAYDNALERFDLGLFEPLETSVSPVQTSRNLLVGVFARHPDENGKDEE